MSTNFEIRTETFSNSLIDILPILEGQLSSLSVSEYKSFPIYFDTMDISGEYQCHVVFLF